MTLNYTDPEDYLEAKRVFDNAGTKEELRKYLDLVFPGWLIGSTDKYCNDYPHFQKNWNIICSQTGVIPQKIVLVDFVPIQNINDSKTDEKNEYKLLSYICNKLTEKGYVIRRKDEFVGCEKCGKAIPIIEIWHLLKEKGIQVPEVWNGKCSRC